MLRIFLACLVVIGVKIQANNGLFANDCPTAVPIALSPNGACAFSSPATFTASTISSGNPGGCGMATASSAWFQLDLNTPGLQHDVRVTVSTDFGGNVKAFLSHSEAKDTGSGSPCYFPGTAGGLFFNLRVDACLIFPAGGGSHSFETGGLDGTGTYFLILERPAGAGGTATVCIETLATGAPPVNNRCANPIVLSVGGGIDANTATGGTGTWSYGLDGTIRYATKQRMQNGCGGANPHTEDHFWHTNFTGCYVNRPIGTLIGGLGVANPCVASIQNSVFYRFNTPPGSPNNNWFLHIGDMDCPYEPNEIEIMLFSSMDCNNARNSNRILCRANVRRKFNFPAPDSVIALPALNPATTYWIVVDGVRGSQCAYKMLLTRSEVNPVLPAEIASLQAIPGAQGMELQWESRLEYNLSGYEVQRSADGEDFETLGWQPALAATGQGSLYRFMDDQPLIGKSFYRLLIEDLDGAQTLSQTIETYWSPAAQTRFLGQRFSADGMELLAEVYLSDAGFVQLTCLDAQGRRAGNWKGALAAGGHTLSLDARTWSAGLYFLAVSANGDQATAKVIRP